MHFIYCLHSPHLISLLHSEGCPQEQRDLTPTAIFSLIGLDSSNQLSDCRDHLSCSPVSIGLGGNLVSLWRILNFIHYETVFNYFSTEKLTAPSWETVEPVVCG